MRRFVRRLLHVYVASFAGYSRKNKHYYLLNHLQLPNSYVYHSHPPIPGQKNLSSAEPIISSRLVKPEWGFHSSLLRDKVLLRHPRIINTTRDCLAEASLVYMLRIRQLLDHVAPQENILAHLERYYNLIDIPASAQSAALSFPRVSEIDVPFS